jgi:hypothetical protein
LFLPHPFHKGFFFTCQAGEKEAFAHAEGRSNDRTPAQVIVNIMTSQEFKP